MMLLPLVYLLIFKYYPMVGAQMAFKDYNLLEGIWGSPWVGFKHFIRFFNSYEFWLVLRNTVGLSLYSLVAGFPLPIVLALSLNYISSAKYKKTVQMVTYAPHFISTVVMVGMILQFLAPRTGFVNILRDAIGLDQINFIGEPGLFKSIYVWTDVWQNVGYASIIYLASLSTVDPNLHEAALIEGATKPQRMWHIDLPGILPTAIIILILNTGRILEVGFEKAYLMQNPLNLSSSEIISTYVYKIGIAGQAVNFSYPTAIGLFKSVIGFLLLMTVNRLSRAISRQSLW